MRTVSSCINPSGPSWITTGNLERLALHLAIEQQRCIASFAQAEPVRRHPEDRVHGLQQFCDEVTTRDGMYEDRTVEHDILVQDAWRIAPPWGSCC